MKLERRRSRIATCNLCCGTFRRKSIYMRFCDTCRKENELYRFADCWAGSTRGAVASDAEEFVAVSEIWARA